MQQTIQNPIKQRQHTNQALIAKGRVFFFNSQKKTQNIQPSQLLCICKWSSPSSQTILKIQFWVGKGTQWAGTHGLGCKSSHGRAGPMLVTCMSCSTSHLPGTCCSSKTHKCHKCSLRFRSSKLGGKKWYKKVWLYL